MTDLPRPEKGAFGKNFGTEWPEPGKTEKAQGDAQKVSLPESLFGVETPQ